MATEIEQLAELQATIGPKRVKTTEVEVESHSLQDLLKAQRQLGQVKPVLASMFVQIATPHGCSCVRSTHES